MILSRAKPFTKKNARTACKFMQRKKSVSDFSTLSIDDIKTKNTQICFARIKIFNRSQDKTTLSAI